MRYSKQEPPKEKNLKHHKNLTKIELIIKLMGAFFFFFQNKRDQTIQVNRWDDHGRYGTSDEQRTEEGAKHDLWEGREGGNTVPPEY